MGLHVQVGATVIGSRALGLGVVALMLAALASLAPVSAMVPTCAAAGAHHAALVVDHGDGSAVTRCVAFDTSQISGEQLLTLSGIAWSGQTFGGFGEAVCALDGEPARYVDCPGKDSYWAVFVSNGGGAWQLAGVGISSLVLGDGDAEGFRYVPASGVAAVPSSPAGLCPVRTPASASAPAPTSRVSGSTSPAIGPSATGSSATGGETAGPSGSLASSAAATGAASSASSAAAATGATAVTRSASSGPIPAAPGGPDTGLLAASVAGGALVGLAFLRLAARRRSRR